MRGRRAVSSARGDLLLLERAHLLSLGLLVVGIGLSTGEEGCVRTGEGRVSALLSVAFHTEDRAHTTRA